MRIVLTGAAGFLGWHTRVRLHALTAHEVVPVGRSNWAELVTAVADADAVIHVAGVNRGADTAVEGGNVALADDVARAVRKSRSVRRVVYANSIHAGLPTPYGTGKAMAAQILADAARAAGACFVDVRLPNLFGEGARPHYNSFVATFVDAVVTGAAPKLTDRAIELMHAQDAADALIEGLQSVEPSTGAATVSTTVREVYDLLVQFQRTYVGPDLPPLTSTLRRDLFNCYRAALFPQRYPLVLGARTDHRGRLVESVRAHGGQGQTFVSTTAPGLTRGDHFHLGKVERFVVLKGTARIRLRRLFSSDVVRFDVDGEHPVAIDMPTFWVHNISNTGTDELTTLFWTDRLFDAEAPDTFPESVAPSRVSA